MKLDPKKTAFIIIEMVDAIVKDGPGPTYILPDNSKEMVATSKR